MEQVITNQPQSAIVYSNDLVTVRRMTAADAAFMSRLSVEAFRSKYETAIGKNKIDKLIQVMTKSIEKGNAAYFERNLIGLYNGESAGVCTIKFHGSDSSSGDDSDYNELDCKSLCCLVCMHLVTDESVSAGSAYIEQICVDDKFRGKGIGKVLLQAADIEARNRNCNRIFLAVTQTNRARNLYERQGYRISENMNGCCTSCIIGERKFYKMDKSLL